MGFLNKRKVFEKLRTHPYFAGERNHKVFWFTCPETQEQYEIVFRDKPKGSPYPIGWDTRGDEPEIGETPKWYQKLYIQTYEWYFERDQEEDMKLILEPKRKRHYKNILFMTALEEGKEAGKYFFATRIGVPEVFIDKKDRKFLKRFEKQLRKYDYQTEVEKQENGYLLKIKEA